LDADGGSDAADTTSSTTTTTSTSAPEQETLLLVEGSTGGAGLRALQGDEPVPLTASVLYFDRTSHSLEAYDTITVAGLGGTGATIERHIVDHDRRGTSDPVRDQPGTTR
jgi:hypothetical protein